MIKDIFRTDFDITKCEMFTIFKSVLLKSKIREKRVEGIEKNIVKKFVIINLLL
jgi:hypothetical protein